MDSLQWPIGVSFEIPPLTGGYTRPVVGGAVVQVVSLFDPISRRKFLRGLDYKLTDLFHTSTRAVMDPIQWVCCQRVVATLGLPRRKLFQDHTDRSR